MENIMWSSVEIIFAIIFAALTILFMQAFLQQKRSVKLVVRIIVLAMVVIATYISGYYFNDNTIVVTCASILSAFFIGIVFFRVKMVTVILATFCSTLAGAISELMAALLVTSTQEVPLGEVTQHTMYRLQGSTITVLFMLLIILMIKLLRRGRIGYMTTRVIFALCAMPVISTFGTLQYAIYIIRSPYIPTMTEIIPIISIAIINVFFVVFIENIIRQSENTQKLILIEAQNEAQQKYITLLTESQLLIRTISHDFKQQVHELYVLSAEKNIDKLQNRLFELSNRESINLLVDTGNIMLDSILSAKFEIINKHEILLKCKFDIEPDIEYFGTEICTLLGNALDNAIEACLRGENCGFIGLEISATPKQFLCHIINSIGAKPQIDGEKLQTSKDDKILHGVGFQSMSRICRELGGSIIYDFDDKNFYLWIELMFSE